MMPTHALYGTLPPGLLEMPAGALPCSPLQPGAIALETLAEASLTRATLYAPPGTLERRYTLALALRALAVGGTLTALAPKDKGGSRIAAELEHFGCTVTDTSRSHHRIVTTTRLATLQHLDEALAAGAPQMHPAHGLWTQPGIFSWDRVDTGTHLLLAHLPPMAGSGADLGCGLGILSRAVLASPTVTALTLVDVDRRAVEAATRNIADARASCIWADVRHAPLPTALDFVVMNPPFHDAGAEDKSLGLAFVARAADALKHGGVCWLVANRHLPYEALLAERFRRIDRIAEADGFKIYRAEK